MWNVTPSKSDTVWSMWTGGALFAAVSWALRSGAMGECVPGEALGQHRLDEGVLVVEEKHRGRLGFEAVWVSQSQRVLVRVVLGAG
ncbi:hypothetical protein MKX07_006319 [Trichoderma sp. CBMAI-0711]|nr:hypothetical protein MKX07_006319 [Trichoderma sp. CBMAI-0711]